MEAHILALIERQAQPAVGTQVVAQQRENEPSSLYELFRKMGVIEFTGSEDPLQADNWIMHIENVFEIH